MWRVFICLKLAGLPAEKDLKVKVENLRICFRHYEARSFNDGGQIRLQRGKLFKVNFGVVIKNLGSKFHIDI